MQLLVYVFIILNVNMLINHHANSLIILCIYLSA